MSALAGPAAADAAPCTEARPSLAERPGPMKENNPEPWQATGSRPRRKQPSMDNLKTPSVGGCSKPTDAAAIHARA